MKGLWLSIFIACSLAITAQQLPTPRNIRAVYDKGTRSETGSPGKNYWQNSASYDLQVVFDPSNRLLIGKTNIVYTNNSPDTLKQVWFKLYPNIYKSGSPRNAKFEPSDIGEGMIIDSVRMNERSLSLSQFNMNGTNYTLGKQKIAPGATVQFNFSYHYTVNKGSHMRTGEIDPGADFIAYFFPRVAVYDDIDGWNTYPYLGNLEFYNDFCRFHARITVPSGFGVWATGDLKNAEQVLNPVYLERLKQAETRDEVRWIIDSNEIRKRDINKGSGPQTWEFDASNVTDFVFAVSDHYVWQSTSLVVDPASGRRTRADAVFNPIHADYFNVVHDARKTVDAMSYRFPAWPFPYSHITVFDGLDQMEYPMMVNDNPVEDRAESIELTDHEIFHTMFPFYMGINETKYAWMDEGWATIGEWVISPMIDSTLVDEYGVNATSFNAGNETDLPIITLSSEINRSYFTNSYPKPAMGYLFIRDYLGDSLFKKALHHYIRTWQGKHPMPNDFFYSMNAGSGKNLNWFWKKWFFEQGMPDLAIAEVKKLGKGYQVKIEDRGGRPVPIDLVISYTDGTTEKKHLTIGAWEKAPKSVMVATAANKTPVTVRLGDPHTPDSNPKDNIWEKK